MITAPGRTVRVAGTCGVLATGLLLASCRATAGRELVVQFKLDPTTHLPSAAAVAAVRQDCPGNASVTLEPAPTSTLLSVRQHPVRYDANHADDRTLAQLIECIEAVPGVLAAGLTETDT